MGPRPTIAGDATHYRWCEARALDLEQETEYLDKVSSKSNRLADCLLLLLLLLAVVQIIDSDIGFPR